MRYVSCIASSFGARLTFDGRRTTPEGHRETSPSWDRELPIFHAEPEADGVCACLGARADVELAENRGDMVIDRLLGEDEPLGDLRVAEPLRHQGEHLELACGQPGGVRLGRGPRAAGQPANAALTEAARNDRRRRRCAEAAQLLERTADE